ncbi:MAG: hypothetical protein H0V29_05610 [Thermoleophilaceae bacterium]|nr:hypothetical protein [Thermoleophilaceae bacterium]
MHSRARIALCLVASMLAVGLVVGPVAAADAASKNVTSKKFKKSIKRIDQTVKDFENFGKNSRTEVLKNSGGVAGIQALIPTFVSSLTALQSGLLGLQAALQDPTTGLVGLNNARPQFGAFSSTGTFIAGTGANPPAKGPSGNAVQGAGPGTYVVNFNNDVSSRYTSANPFPGSSSAGAPQTVTCANPAAVATCNTISAGTGGSTSHVLVVFSTGVTPPAGGFSISAISG